MASSLQRPALRATAALLRSSPSPATTVRSAGATADLRASLTTTAAAAARRSFTGRTTACACRSHLVGSSRHRSSPVAWVVRRAFSSSLPTGESKIYSFEDVQKLTEAPDSPIVIIDTREPAELKDTGRIPGAVNVPVASAPDSFFIPDEEFEDRFGFSRPSRDTEVVFYCKAGVRSRAAAGLARDAGWTKVGEYPGSWLDWAGNGGAVQR